MKSMSSDFSPESLRLLRTLKNLTRDRPIKLADLVKDSQAHKDVNPDGLDMSKESIEKYVRQTVRELRGGGRGRKSLIKVSEVNTGVKKIQIEGLTPEGETFLKKVQRKVEPTLEQLTETSSCEEDSINKVHRASKEISIQYTVITPIALTLGAIIVLLVGVFYFWIIFLPMVWEVTLYTIINPFVNPLLENWGIPPIRDQFVYYHYFTDSYLVLSLRDFIFYTWRQLSGVLFFFIILLFLGIPCFFVVVNIGFQSPVQSRDRMKLCGTGILLVGSLYFTSMLVIFFLGILVIISYGFYSWNLSQDLSFLIFLAVPIFLFFGGVIIFLCPSSLILMYIGHKIRQDANKQYSTSNYFLFGLVVIIVGGITSLLLIVWNAGLFSIFGIITGVVVLVCGAYIAFKKQEGQICP